MVSLEKKTKQKDINVRRDQSSSPRRITLFLQVTRGVLLGKGHKATVSPLLWNSRKDKRAKNKVSWQCLITNVNWAKQLTCLGPSQRSASSNKTNNNSVEWSNNKQEEQPHQQMAWVTLPPANYIKRTLPSISPMPPKNHPSNQPKSGQCQLEGAGNSKDSSWAHWLTTQLPSLNMGHLSSHGL